jgi:hypothetical protein
MNSKKLLVLLTFFACIAHAVSVSPPSSHDCMFHTNSIPAGVVTSPAQINENIQKALEYADYVLELLEMDMPNIQILPNSTEAYVQGDTVFMGELLATQMSPIGLAQLLLHEVGHIAEGHVHHDTAERLNTLVELGVLTPEQQAQIAQFEELSADVYAAFATWILEPGRDISEFGQWLSDRGDPPSNTHPDADTRNEFIAAVIESLNQAVDNGDLSGTFLADVHEINSTVQSLTHNHDDESTDDGDDGNDDGDGNDGGDGGDGGGDGGGTGQGGGE